MFLSSEKALAVIFLVVAIIVYFLTFFTSAKSVQKKIARKQDLAFQRLKNLHPDKQNLFKNFKEALNFIEHHDLKTHLIWLIIYGAIVLLLGIQRLTESASNRPVDLPLVFLVLFVVLIIEYFRNKKGISIKEKLAEQKASELVVN